MAPKVLDTDCGQFVHLMLGGHCLHKLHLQSNQHASDELLGVFLQTLQPTKLDPLDQDVACFHCGTPLSLNLSPFRSAKGNSKA